MSTRHRTNENTQGDEYYAVVIEYIFDHNTCAGEIVFKTIIDKFKYSNIQNETEQCILPGGTKSRSSSLTAWIKVDLGNQQGFYLQDCEQCMKAYGLFFEHEKDAKLFQETRHLLRSLSVSH